MSDFRPAPSAGLRQGIFAAILDARPALARLALFVACYLAGAGVAQVLAFIPESGISIWPPSGIYLATLLVTSRSSWPWWVASGLATELLANLLWFQNLGPVAVLIHLGNAGEAVTGALLVQAACGRTIRLQSMREVVALIGLAAAVAPAVSATIGSASLHAFGLQSFQTAWPLFYVGDATGVVVVAPLALVMMQGFSHVETLSLPRLAEAGTVAAVLLVVGALALGGYLPFAYIVMPALLWAAVRFEFTGAVLTLLLLSVLATFFTVSGFGQFSDRAADPTQRHVLMQLFLVVSAVSALVVAALSRQHQQALLTLKRANEDLEARIGERTARLAESERRLSALLGALPLGVALVDRRGEALAANDVYRRFVPGRVPSQEEVPTDRWSAKDPSGRPLPRSDFPTARALRGDHVWPGQDFLYRADAGQPGVWMRVSAIPFRGADEAVTGAIVTILDIDEEKRATARLQVSEERLRASQEAAELGNWEFDHVAGVPIWSDRARIMIGAPPDEPASLDGLLCRMHPEDRAAFLCALEDLQRPFGPDSYRGEFRILLDGGDERWLEDRGKVERDGDGRPLRTVGMTRDVTLRKRHEQQNDLLMREVNHRAKNLLTLVAAIARQTAATRPDDFVVRFEERIRALSSSHDLLVHSGWKGVALTDLVRSQLAHFQDLLGSRITVSGAPITISPAAAQSLGIAIHELATNAGKYGALSNGDGRVDVGWALDRAEDRFSMSWVESGGPPVRQPERRGFGILAIRRMSELALEAEVGLDFDPAGIRWQLSCTSERVLQP